MSSPSKIRFGLFEVDTRSGELRRNGYRINLQDQPFQALLLLLEHPGEVVTREDLHKQLWPQHTFVDFDRGLNKAINKLRAALRDNADNPRFIETLPQRGYRFIAAVDTPSPVASAAVETGRDLEQAEVQFQSAPEASLIQELTAPPIALNKGRRRYAYYSLGVLIIVCAAIGGRFGWITTQAKWIPPRMGSESRLIANSPDLPVTSAVISPDGKYLAYTDSTGLYIHLVISGETHAVLLPKGFDPSVNGWFPDSVHLVVSWVEHAEKPPSLWALSAMGGAPRKLADIGSCARVSPDGTQVAFLKGPWDNKEIWLVDGNGNGARRVIDGGNDAFGPITWAPDGKRIAYVRGSAESPAAQIETYNLADGHIEKVLSTAGIGSEIAWVQTGRLIYSLRESQPNQSDFNLWSIQLDTHTGRPSGLPVRMTNAKDLVAGISATSDGKQVALLRAKSQADVYLAELDKGGRRLSPLRRFTYDERQDFPSSWTPDSKAVLVVSDRDGPSHIFKQKTDEIQPELLVGGKGDVWLPHMAPDGSSVLYLASAAQVGASDNVRLMRMSLSGGPSYLVLEEPGIVNYQCARLPSRMCVYGQVDSEYYRFFSFDPRNGERAEIKSARLGKEVGLNSWNLSPDGRYLVTCKSQDPYVAPVIRVLSLADGKETLLPVTGVKLITGTDWAANSKSIWVGGFMGRGSWGTRSGLINVDLTGQVRTLIAGQTPSILGATPSPDGRHLAIGANTTSANVWLLENF